jgi:hypothetical protein
MKSVMGRWVCKPAIASRSLRMISYQLARSLKDAGFPQSNLARAQQQAGYDYVSLPTLSTLIEACGENFGALGREPDCWVACEYVSEGGEWTNAHEGETPEDAVARLGLSWRARAVPQAGDPGARK